MKPSSKLLFNLMQEFKCHQQLHSGGSFRPHFLIFLTYCHLLQTAILATFDCLFPPTALFLLFSFFLWKKGIVLPLPYPLKKENYIFFPYLNHLISPASGLVCLLRPVVYVSSLTFLVFFSTLL